MLDPALTPSDAAPILSDADVLPPSHVLCCLTSPWSQVISVHTRTVNCVRYHATEPYTLFSASQDRTVRRWDVRTAADGSSAAQVFTTRDSVRQVRCAEPLPAALRACAHTCAYTHTQNTRTQNTHAHTQNTHRAASRSILPGSAARRPGAMRLYLGGS